ncbi:Arc family DNA-binding protein [Sediminicoccus sp. KRV36]|uniref:FitA-like ribbon-helix-helix domain-containing protein n=1 Tax=Sediminicoccus sp. KRV36 TaxID=3133721 RepID=UPI0020100EAE|nr:Arc family DNA-binding protein [Sediminicoccus rosea]UPY36004.1 Arc family DNA-binding protein [Sediminicoccus rosea]
MPVTLSIKHAPDHVVQRLRERAARNHRSLQGELLAIIEKASMEPPVADALAVLEAVRALGLETPADGVEIIRADRDRDSLAGR